jgi:hypothetical protein
VTKSNLEEMDVEQLYLSLASSLSVPLLSVFAPQ